MIHCLCFKINCWWFSRTVLKTLCIL